MSVSWKIAAVYGLTFALGGGALFQVNSPRQVLFPQPDLGAATLAARAQAQRETLGQFRVFTAFHFTDKLTESGITFRYQAVSDALQNYKAVHYDHGSAVAAADVDGNRLAAAAVCRAEPWGRVRKIGRAPPPAPTAANPSAGVGPSASHRE